MDVTLHMDEQACSSSYTTPSTSPWLSQEKDYFSLLHGMSPWIPMQYSISVSLSANANKRGQDVPRDPTYQLSSAITLQENSWKLKVSWPLAVKMKCNGEVSLKSKSTLSTASVQTLLTARFEIKHRNWIFFRRSAGAQHITCFFTAVRSRQRTEVPSRVTTCC